MFKVPTLLPIKASVKNGNIQRRLAWSLGKDDTHSSRKSRKFFFLYIRDSGFLLSDVFCWTQFRLPFRKKLLG